MNNIRVCHMTSAHESTDVRIFHKECSSLAKVPNYEVFLVAKGKSRTENNVNVIGIDNSGLSRIKRMLYFTRKVYKRALAVNADIYHFHDPELLIYALKFKKRGKVVIFDSHEDTYQQIMIKEYIPSILRKLVGKIYLKYETYICKRIDAVIFPCTIEKKHPFENRAKKHIYINNYPKIIDEQVVKPNNIAMCYVGSLTEKRGVTTLLEAYKEFSKNVPLILAGKFESTEYMEQLKSKGLLEGVDYKGQCTQEEVKEIYKRSHIGISNLYNVGQYPKLGTFPTKVYEYMANGLATIVTDYPFSREVFEKNNLGILVDPKCPISICNAMEKLSDDKTCIETMGQNGVELIKTKYNWENEAKKLIALYNETLFKKKK